MKERDFEIKIRDIKEAICKLPSEQQSVLRNHFTMEDLLDICQSEEVYQDYKELVCSYMEIFQVSIDGLENLRLLICPVPEEVELAS